MSLKDSVFLKACRRESTPFTPVWLMRQAGRYMQDYRAIREKTPFLKLCKNPSLAAEVTVTAQEKLGVDAAILFSDILLILEPMGFDLAYLAGDGPSIRKPLQTSDDVDRMKIVDAEDSLAFVLQALREIRRRLKPTIPLIGFAGAPFTLASYLIEGGSSKDFARTKKFMHEDASRWNILMEKITTSTLSYLEAQIRSGADALQLFDSWAGILSPEEYRTYAFPHSRRIFAGLKGRVPLIHFGTKTAPFLEDLTEAGGDVIGVDHRIGLNEAWERIGPEKAIQGNLDPNLLLGDLETLEKEVKRVLLEANGRPGHIFNLGHGVLPETPVENVVALVDMVHSLSKKKAAR